MTTSTTTIRVTEPRELLALIPYQLGFAPADSLVVVALRAPRGRVGLIARVDLADAEEAAATVAAHLVTDSAARAVIVTYTGNPAAARAATAALTEALAGVGIAASDGWTVGPTGYRSTDCEDLACCPEAGHPLSDLDGTQVAAAFTYAGIGTAPTRADLGVKPATGPGRRAANRAGSTWLRTHAIEEIQTRAAGLCAWQDAIATTGPVPAARLGIIAAALTSKRVRDAVVVGLIPGTPQDLPAQVAAGEGDGDVARAMGGIIGGTTGIRPGAAADQATRLLIAVAAHAGATRAAAPLTLLALIAWWSGDGARASVLLEQALTLDPAHRLAVLLAEALDGALPPGWLRREA